MHGNVRSALSDAISAAHRDSGNYGYYVDHSGDGSEGQVVYQSGGKLKQAPYSMGKNADGKQSTTVNTDKAKNVTAVTSYKESDGRPAISRKPPSSEDIARLNALQESGILSAAQVQEALSASSDGKPSSDVNRETSPLLKLNESTSWAADHALNLIEAAGAVRMPIKLIAPGKGSSAFYPAEVLKRDGPNVFTKGTHIYINHATSAEEAARPEGDWHKLVGALEGNAYYDEAGKAGPGLYGNALFTSDIAPLIKEKAPFTGMSIRASGLAEAGKQQDGLPILKKLTHAESVDVVTRAGAGGMILVESASGAKNQGDKEMTKEEIQALVEAGVAAKMATLTADPTTKRLLERALKGDAVVIATRVLSTLALPEMSKQRVIESVTERAIPLTATGEVDEAKLTEAVNAEAKREGAYVASLTGGARVIGMGTAPAVQLDEAEIKRQKEAAIADDKDAESVFMRFGLNEAQAKASSRRGAA